MTQSLNPLKTFFRQPAIYVRLPSDGQYWPDGSLEIPPNRELPVLPMTAMDEITYRTPDALFNGAAIVSVIQSCMPNIKNAWHIPNCDLNAVLTAIRIASYSKAMPISSTCPACEVENEFDVDLQAVMSQLNLGDYTKTVKHGDLEIYFQPMNYQNQTDINLLQFEQQRVLGTISQIEMAEEEKNQRINQAVKAITEITIKAIKNTIKSIRTPQAIVTEPEFIHEFLLNCDRTLYAQIRDHAIELRVTDDFKPIDIQCPECNHNYQQQFTLDTATFFDNAS
jgi:hypothetical protein